MSNPKAKFFCEYCDTEVPQQAIICPKCGHFFASVRCPECGHTGTQREFSNGCKVCGYAFSHSKSNTKSSSSKNQQIKTKLPPKAKYKTRKLALKEIAKKEKNPPKEDSLPTWIYLFSISVLIILLVVIISKQ